ncbi:DUF92 domain-containing protein [Bacillus tuaregi]|uniref:DUF92 domain-containing protein n=1 Tax=Bacillus tuaregi TaxID=1816695 RepID=UPI0008F887DF|nr:DUF92 domain-containing protein [Bacillus tuaregi]
MTIVIVLSILTAAILGYYSKLLTITGSAAAFVIGALITLGLGIKGLVLLGLFFGSSSAWSKVKSTRKQRAEEILVKGSQRDWQQVFANGALAAFSSAMYYYTKDFFWVLGFSICLAASNSDTWASEIGSMSKGRPVNVKTFQRVARGTSGAISVLGTVAAAAGSCVVALGAFLLFQLPFNEFLFILILGFCGNVIDTLLGAFVQAEYQCPNCGLKTEKKKHCGHRTRLIKGFSILNNDVVNFLSVLIILFVSILISGVV